LPFTLFAVFPQWLQSLPKSGGWLNTVKVTLGFIELALSLKFLSLADQAYHWGILSREVNIAIWVAISIGLALYLFGLITFPHDDKTERIGVMRGIFGLSSLAFAFYILPGLWGAPLKPLSGYLPPMSSEAFSISQVNASITPSNICDSPKYGDKLHLPHGLKGYFDYEQALAGHGCVNCREMEANVWSAPPVLSLLQNDFVILALYVDDKTELPETEWYTSTYDGKQKTTIGKKNADFQITKYNNNAQPYYLVLDTYGNIMSGPKAYDKSVENFVKFLEKGKNNFYKTFSNP
jgi:thiol:disulfide interchange protein DsbD